MPKKSRDSPFNVKLENIVAFTSLGITIPLNSLVKKMDNAEYRPEQFPGLIYRIKDPMAAALIFSSGKIVCTGAKTVDLANQAIKKVVKGIGTAGIKVPKDYNVVVENIVASSSIVSNLNLEEITYVLENAEYEPEQFPGLVYRIKDPRVAFLLFRSGKIICTGARSVKDVHTALSKLKLRLEEIGIDVKPGAEMN